jgi:hypothetical protein
MSEPKEEFRVVLASGKYTVIYQSDSTCRFLRYNEAWPAADEGLRFSNVVSSLVYRVHELEEAWSKLPHGIGTYTEGPAQTVVKEPEIISTIDGTTRKAHYGSGPQPWDHIKAAGWGPEFAAGNTLKYVRRYANKNGADDLEKGRWYYNELIRMCAASEDSWKQAASVFLRLELLLTQDERKLLRGA